MTDELPGAIARRTPSYRQAVTWVAHNDGPEDPGATDPKTLCTMTTVLMVADLFGVSPEAVAMDIAGWREKARDRSR